MQNLIAELLPHFRSPELTDAQKVLLFLLATDPTRSRDVSQPNQSDLARMTGSTRETVRNRIKAMPKHVTKKMFQVKDDLRLCTYTLHLKESVTDSAVTVAAQRPDPKVADCAALGRRDVADDAVIYIDSLTSNKKSGSNRESSRSTDLEYPDSIPSYSKMTAESATDLPDDGIPF